MLRGTIGIAAVLICAFWSQHGWAKLKVGAKVPALEISEPDGALVKGGSWSTSTLPGKVHIIFYVDPDEKDANEDLEEALKAKDFPNENFASVAIINMAATWLPNAVINMSLKSKQKKYKRTIYIKDLKKVFVNKWGLADDSYHVVLTDKGGTVRFSKAGTLNKAEIDAVLNMISQYLAAGS